MGRRQPAGRVGRAPAGDRRPAHAGRPPGAGGAADRAGRGAEVGPLGAARPAGRRNCPGRHAAGGGGQAATRRSGGRRAGSTRDRSAVRARRPQPDAGRRAVTGGRPGRRVAGHAARTARRPGSRDHRGPRGRAGAVPTAASPPVVAAGAAAGRRAAGHGRGQRARADRLPHRRSGCLGRPGAGAGRRGCGGPGAARRPVLADHRARSSKGPGGSTSGKRLCGTDRPGQIHLGGRVGVGLLRRATGWRGGRHLRWSALPGQPVPKRGDLLRGRQRAVLAIRPADGRRAAGPVPGAAGLGPGGRPRSRHSR